jgi:hypothetical protein
MPISALGKKINMRNKNTITAKTIATTDIFLSY